MKHELKSHPQYFRATWRGFKPFEIRINDRNFQPFDEVSLNEWDPETQEYTGRVVEGWINYVTTYEQKEGYVVFSIEETGRTEG